MISSRTGHEVLLTLFLSVALLFAFLGWARPQLPGDPGRTPNSATARARQPHGRGGGPTSGDGQQPTPLG